MPQGVKSTEELEEDSHSLHASNGRCKRPQKVSAYQLPCLHLFSKVFTNIISETLDANQPKGQTGFRSEFSTMEHIQTVSQTVEKTNEYRKPFCLTVTGYVKSTVETVLC